MEKSFTQEISAHTLMLFSPTYHILNFFKMKYLEVLAFFKSCNFSLGSVPNPGMWDGDSSLVCKTCRI